MGNTNSNFCNDPVNQGDLLNEKKDNIKKLPWENEDDERKHLSETYYV